MQDDLQFSQSFNQSIYLLWKLEIFTSLFRSVNPFQIVIEKIYRVTWTDTRTRLLASQLQRNFREWFSPHLECSQAIGVPGLLVFILMRPESTEVPESPNLCHSGSVERLTEMPAAALPLTASARAHL